MDRPPADPRRLLDEWMEWERGEATPGRVMANLKTAGLREVLEELAAQAGAVKAALAPPADETDAAGSEATSAWTPTV